MDDKEYLVKGRGSYMARGSRFESRGRGSKDEVEGRNSRSKILRKVENTKFLSILKVTTNKSGKTISFVVKTEKLRLWLCRMATVV
jgi:hypothetical protein